TVEHDGYIDEAARASQGKFERNLRLLKRHQRLYPNDPTTPYYLAVEYAMLGQVDRALRLVRRGMARFRADMSLDFLGAMHCQAMRYALGLNRPRLAIKLGKEAVQSFAYSEP